MNLVPITLKQAKDFVTKIHRHCPAPQGHKVSVGVEVNGKLVGVGIAGRPVARALDDGRTMEITRVATDGTKNACSMIYGALRKAGRALGYTKFITYTLGDEPGTSLRASGWTIDAENVGGGQWTNRKGRKERNGVLAQKKTRWVSR